MSFARIKIAMLLKHQNFEGRIFMEKNFAENDLIIFSDGLKVLVLGSYDYKEKLFILVKKVNETETIAVGDAFFLEVIKEKNGFKCEYVEDAGKIYALMSEMSIP